MPYYVDDPLASAVNFAASYIQGKQAAKQQALQQQMDQAKLDQEQQTIANEAAARQVDIQKQALAAQDKGYTWDPSTGAYVSQAAPPAPKSLKPVNMPTANATVNQWQSAWYNANALYTYYSQPGQIGRAHV